MAPLTVVLALATSALVVAQAPRPDQVFRLDARNGEIVTVTGRVEQHGLERVVVVRKDDQQSRFDSAEVVEVVFGDVPPSYSDAQRYLERKDFENAVARFRVAAGDAATRPVVQGRARLAAAESLMAWGAVDATRFREAADEAQSFLTSFADDRNVPIARALLGRAQLLAGDAAASAATLKSLFEAGQAGTIGYPKALTLQAGHDAAHAFLAAGNSAEASALFDALGTAVAAAPREGLDGLTRARLDGLGELASLGAGFVSLAEGKGDRAESFFRGKVDAMQTGAARNAARLGLGEGLLLQSRLRPAQVALASASALSYSNVDIEARALLGLGQVYVALGDASEAKKSLERVVRVHGATTSAAKAAELLKTL
jgi:TolA-binding protein